jgi:hypothetical protein
MFSRVQVEGRNVVLSAAQGARIISAVAATGPRQAGLEREIPEKERKLLSLIS